MKFKDEHRFLTIDGAQLKTLRECLLVARNCAIRDGKPTEDINEMLAAVLKLGRKNRVKI